MRRELYLILFSLLAWLSPVGMIQGISFGMTASEPIPTNAWVAIDTFAKKHQIQCRLVSNQVILTKNGHRMVLTPGSNQVLFDGIKVFLTYPMEGGRTGGMPTRIAECRVRQLDIHYYLRPLWGLNLKQKRKTRTVVIDPGHGGRQDGTIQHGVKEKDLTLKTALQVASKLRALGYKVYLTRQDDRDISLDDRANLAAKYKADALVSIHYNSAPSLSARGIETYVFHLYGQPGTHSEPSSDDFMPGYAYPFNGQSRCLGWCIQKRIINALKMQDRGVRSENLKVLRLSACPSVLVECGFLSNVQECKKCASPTYQKMLSDAIAQGIHRYFMDF